MTQSTQIVNASAHRVADALTSAAALAVWLSDDALVEQKPDGRVVLWWHDGRQLAGRWTRYESGAAFAWTLSDDAGNRREASFTLAPSAASTIVVVEGADSDAWPAALRHLARYVETGADLRELERPIMGINFDILDEKAARSRGTDLDGAILITETRPETGAAAAGIVSGDVLEMIGDIRVRTYQDLVVALRGRVAGETLEMTYWHGGNRMTASVALQGRQPAALETDPARLDSLVAKDSAERLEALRAAFADASEATAAHRPADDAWSAKEVLGHVIASEMWARGATMATAFGARSLDFWPEKYEELLRSRFQEGMCADAVGATEAEILATSRLCRNLLASDPTPPVVHRIAAEMEGTREHFAEHVAQIRAAIAAAP